MSQSLQLLVIDRIEALLQALKDEGVIKQFYYRHQGISQGTSFPFAFFELAADRGYEVDGKDLGGLSRYRVESRITLTLVIRRESTQAVRELAELEDLVRRRIATDLPDPECRLTIDGLPTAFDAFIANLFNEYAHGTIAIDYSGFDDYSTEGVLTYATASLSRRW